MAESSMSDDFVAELLKQDAQKATKNYSLQGLGAYLPKKSVAQAPRPNTRFLRNILRETDSHNQALLAKEAEEARTRLKALKQDHDRDTRRERHDKHHRDSHHSRHPNLAVERHRTKRARVDLSSLDKNRLSPPKESKRYMSRRNDSPERIGKRSRTRYEDSEEEQYRAHQQSRGKHGRHDSDHNGARRTSSDKRNEHRSRSHSAAGSSEDSPLKLRREESSKRHRRKEEIHGVEQRSRHAHRMRSPTDTRFSPERSISNSRSKHKRRRRDSSSSCAEETLRLKEEQYSSSNHDATSFKAHINPSRRISGTGSDSDPLEDLIGPLPPPAPPKVKVRGRGAIFCSAMDSRFLTGYDPATDVTLDVDEQDNWEQALEALRDRAKFKQNQGDRLRAAGFTEEEVKKWEKGGEKDEEDVKWAKKGEGREWDRGKVFDDAGTTYLEPEWGRLKGT